MELQNNNNSNNESARSISEMWINLIFKSLERLQEHEIISRDGCLSLTEYLQIDSNMIPQLRLKNLSLMISEFDICLSNCIEILKSEQVKEFKTKLKFIQELFDGKKKNKKGEAILVSRIMKDDIQHKSKIVLNNNFDVCSRMIYQLREELVSSLSHILFAKREEFKQNNLQT